MMQQADDEGSDEVQKRLLTWVLMRSLAMCAASLYMPDCDARSGQDVVDDDVETGGEII